MPVQPFAALYAKIKQISWLSTLFTQGSMNKQPFIERMLETENLTDELEDADASWLLDWGNNQLDLVLKGVKKEETANQRVTDLMAVMRKINRVAGSYKGKDPQALAEDLAELKSLRARALRSKDNPAELPQADLQAAAAHMQQLSPREALEYLAQGDY